MQAAACVPQRWWLRRLVFPWAEGLDVPTGIVLVIQMVTWFCSWLYRKGTFILQNVSCVPGQTEPIQWWFVYDFLVLVALGFALLKAWKSLDKQSASSIYPWTNFSVEKEARSIKIYWMPFLEKWFGARISESPKFILMLPSLLTEGRKMLCYGSTCSWAVTGRIFVFMDPAFRNECVWHAEVSKGTFSSASNLKKLHKDLFYFYLFYYFIC